jgi:Bacterial Ig-like domain (group 3)
MGARAKTGRLTTFLTDLEQVHVTRIFCRSLRLQWVATLGIVFAIPALAATAASPQQATQTTLLVDTHDLAGQTQATLSITVAGADGSPATGSIAINDHGRPLAGFALDPQGHATATVALAPGDHNLSAVYTGDTAHLTSSSQVAPVHAVAGTTPDFSVSIAPGTLSLKQGQSGSATVSVTPISAASLSAPMFVTISCAGLPDQTACTFTPENIQIPVGATADINSSMVLATQAPTLVKAEPIQHRDARPIALALALPGSLAFVGLAFGARRRRFFSRLVLLALVGFVAVLGATACNPLYNYKNHGPTPNLPTPAGTYNVTISAQSSNGVTATTHTTTLALTVTQ